MRSLEYLGRARTIHCIGDSNVLVFDHLTFRDARAGVLYACRSGYMPGMTASGLLDARGELAAPLRAQLIAHSLCANVDDNLIAVHASGVHHWRRVETIRETAAREPAIVFHFGDLDLRFVVIPRLAANDFVYPNAPPGSAIASVDGTREVVPFSLVRELTRAALGPYFGALTALRTLGFERLFVHTLAPQTTDDAVFASKYGPAPMSLRYKTLHLFNDTLRELAREREIGVIDTWTETTTPDGLLDPGFDLDGAHLNTAAARISVAKVVAALET